MFRIFDTIKMFKDIDSISLPSFPSVEHLSELCQIIRENIEEYRKNKDKIGFARKMLFKYYQYKDFVELKREIKEFDKENTTLKEELEKTTWEIDGIYTLFEKIVLKILLI